MMITLRAGSAARGTFNVLLMILLLAACALFATARAAESSSVTVTDMLNRTVTLPAPAKRIVLAESRHIMTLALLDKDPLSRVVAWGTDLQRYSPSTWQALKQRFPQAASIPEIGDLNSGTFSMEAAIAAKPDLVVFTLYGPIPDGLSKLDAAHVPYVFVDFFRHPLTKTVPSMRMLGKLTGHEQQAEAFIAFYQQHMDDVAKRVAKEPTRPGVFFHLNPGGEECCFTSGKGNMSDFIAVAGGENLGVKTLNQAIGRLNLEYVLAQKPDFYLAGGGSSVSRKGLNVGPGVSAAESARSLKAIVSSPSLASLSAIRNHQGAGIWLFFFDNPLFFIGVEEMAKMLHPAAFADVDPAKTFDELNQRFLAFPLQGSFWTTLNGQE
ncbi:ABC transporter substrate-binding protein [Erwinia sp. SLM-02]|uniref:ABC transporter substrate-binding protein n=1 Tax=Erwinia sp. SLM-02 TaxID=3020057 RepID=UPI003080FDF9